MARDFPHPDPTAQFRIATEPIRAPPNQHGQKRHQDARFFPTKPRHDKNRPGVKWQKPELIACSKIEEADDGQAHQHFRENPGLLLSRERLLDVHLIDILAT